MVLPRGAGGGRRATWLEGAGALLVGLGVLGSLPLLAAGAAELLDPAAARDLSVLATASLALGVVLGAAFGRLLVGSSRRGRLALLLPARLMALAACLAPAALALLATDDGRLLLARTWLGPAALAAAGLGFLLGRSRPRTGRALGLALVGGAGGAALAPTLATLRPDLAPPLVGLLLLTAAPVVLGSLLHLLGELLRGPGAPRPADPAGAAAPQHPRLAGCLLLAVALVAVVVLRTEAVWASLAPGLPRLLPGDPVLVLVALAGLGLGALLLGRPLARSGLAALGLCLAAGLVWWLLHSGLRGPLTGAPLELLALDRLTRPVLPVDLWSRAAHHALALGPLLLALGAAPAALAGRVSGLAGEGRGPAVALAWLLPLGLLLVPAVAAPLLSAPLTALAALVALVLLLVFLDADRPVPRVGAARGRVHRVIPLLLRPAALAGLAVALLLAASGPATGPLPGWHPGAEVAGLDLDASLSPTLTLADPLDGTERVLAPGGFLEPVLELERAAARARDLASGLGLAPSELVLLPADRLAVLDLTTEALTAALADLPAGALLALPLPAELPTGRFALALDTFAGAMPAASAWFVGGQVVLLGGREHRAPDLADLDRGLATLAQFVGVLGPAGLDRRARLELRPASTGPRRAAETQRRRARNLEQLFARGTPIPVAWGPLVAGLDGPLAAHPVMAAGRRMRQAHLAHAWLRHHAEAAPGSLALESWQGRLDQALAACLEALPGHRPALFLADLTEAEAGAREGLALVRAGQDGQAVPLLVAATERFPERGDLTLALALALDRLGNRSAAEVVLGDLDLDGVALRRSGFGRELLELGLDPALLGAGR